MKAISLMDNPVAARQAVELWKFSLGKSLERGRSGRSRWRANAIIASLQTGNVDRNIVRPTPLAGKSNQFATRLFGGVFTDSIKNFLIVHLSP